MITPASVLPMLLKVDRDCLSSGSRDMADAIIESDDCVRMSQLAVNGRDMIDLGAEVTLIGEILKKLLGCVIEETLPNSRDILIEKSKDMLKQASKTIHPDVMVHNRLNHQ